MCRGSLKHTPGPRPRGRAPHPPRARFRARARAVPRGKAWRGEPRVPRRMQRLPRQGVLVTLPIRGVVRGMEGLGTPCPTRWRRERWEPAPMALADRSVSKRMPANGHNHLSWDRPVRQPALTAPSCARPEIHGGAAATQESCVSRKNLASALVLGAARADDGRASQRRAVESAHRPRECDSTQSKRRIATRRG